MSPCLRFLFTACFKKYLLCFPPEKIPTLRRYSWVSTMLPKKIDQSKKKIKIEQASYILKTNFATTDSLKGKFIPLFPKSLSHVLVYACNYLSQAKQSWEEKLSQTIYHIYWFLPLAIYHNQNNVWRKTFLF